MEKLLLCFFNGFNFVDWKVTSLWFGNPLELITCL